MVDRQCPKCEMVVDDDAIFCNGCGLGLESPFVTSSVLPTEIGNSSDLETIQTPAGTVVCPGCAESVGNRSRYCPYCSYDIWTSTPPAPPLSSIQIPVESPVVQFREERPAVQLREEPPAVQLREGPRSNTIPPFPVRPADPRSVDSSRDGTPISAQLIHAAMTRYRHAYYYARFLDTVGKVLKGIGIVVALLIVFAALALSGAASREFGGRGLEVGGTVVIGAGLYGGIFFFVFWLWSVIWRASGQFLKATLDSAVHSSPFLTDLERAELMHLPLVGPNDRGYRASMYDSSSDRISYRPERESWFNPNFVASDDAGFWERRFGGLKTAKACLLCYLSPIVAPIGSLLLLFILQAAVPAISVFGYLAALVSPFVFPAILLTTQPHSRNAAIRFHASQALMLSGALLVTNLLLLFLSQVSDGGINAQAVTLVGLAAWAYFIFLSYKANKGEPVRAPLVGEWAARFSQAI
jgi:uncharacterized membrane protein